MERRLMIAAVIAALSDRQGEPMRPTEIAALVGERTLMKPVMDGLTQLLTHGVAEAATVNGRIVGYRLTVDGQRFDRAAHDVARGAVA